MSKTISGLILIAVGVGMYQAGQMLASLSFPLPWALVYPLIGLLEFASLVVGLFGLFRLIVGFFSPKKKATAARETPPGKGVWPPAPKPPGAA